MTDEFYATELKKTPVIGKTQKEILLVWGKPDTILTKDANHYLRDAEDIDRQLRMVDGNEQHWQYNGYDFEIKFGKCTKVEHMVAWW